MHQIFQGIREKEMNGLDVLTQLAQNPQLLQQIQQLLNILQPNGMQARSDRVDADTAPSSQNSSGSVVATTSSQRNPQQARPDFQAATARQPTQHIEELKRRVEALTKELGAAREALVREQSACKELRKETKSLEETIKKMEHVLEETKEEFEQERNEFGAKLRELESAHQQAMQKLESRQRMVLQSWSAAQQLSHAGGLLVQKRLAEKQNLISLRQPNVTVKREREVDENNNMSPRSKKRTPRTPSLTQADKTPTQVGGTSSVKLEVKSTSTPLSISYAPPPIPLQTPGSIPIQVAVAIAKRRNEETKSSPPPLTPSPGVTGPLEQRSAAMSRSFIGSNSRHHPRSGQTTRSPSPVNPKRGPTMERRFVCTGMNDGAKGKLTAAVQQLGQGAVCIESPSDAVPPQYVTHIVCDGKPMSLKGLCGVVASKWIVSPEYIMDSLAAGFWLDEVDHGALRFYPPPLKDQSFLLPISDESVRARLAQIVEYGGGSVVTSKQAAGAVVLRSGDDLLRFATREIQF
jgi:hypothetical protein